MIVQKSSFSALNCRTQVDKNFRRAFQLDVDYLPVKSSFRFVDEPMLETLNQIESEK